MKDNYDKTNPFEVGRRCGYLETSIVEQCERLETRQRQESGFHLSGTYHIMTDHLNQLFREYREITSQHPLQEELDIMERYLRATRRFNGIITEEQGELLSRDRRAFLQQFL